MTATLTANDTPQIRELADASGLVQGTGLVNDYRAEILGQSIPIDPVTMKTPPLQVTEARPTDAGLELSVCPGGIRMRTSLQGDVWSSVRGAGW